MKGRERLDNPLSKPIEQILIASSGVSWTEHELIRRLVDQNYLAADFGQGSLSLFQTHFMVMNALYRLRRNLEDAQQGSLAISAVAIVYTPTELNAGHHNNSHNSQHRNIQLRDGRCQLEAYYLSWENLASASTASVDELLNSFWRRYTIQDDRLHALQLMELQEPVTLTEIKHRYRQKAMAWHPDRGGCDAQLAKLNEAMEVLKRYYAG